MHCEGKGTLVQIFKGPFGKSHFLLNTFALQSSNSTLRICLQGLLKLFRSTYIYKYLDTS